jgi:hypothetical protein
LRGQVGWLKPSVRAASEKLPALANDMEGADLVRFI